MDTEQEPDPIIEEIYIAARMACLNVESSFYRIEDPMKRESVKDFLAGPEVGRIEAAIDAQVRKAMQIGLPAKIRKEAVSKVKEGMLYWQRTIVKKMGVV